MKIVCTGGCGYVGSRVVDFLLSEGHEVCIVDDLRRGPGEPRSWHNDDCTHIVGSVLEIEHMSFGWHPDAVVHMAAVVGEAACAHGPARTVNVEGTREVLRLGVPTVFFSTCSNYGVSSNVVDETSGLNPLGIYAETKVEAESLVTEAGGCVLRLATVCGPSRNTRYDLFVNEIARAAAMKRPFEVRSGDTWRPYVHVGDVGLVVAYLARKSFPSGLWNVVGENMRKMDVVKMARAAYPDLRLVGRSDAGHDKRDYRVSGMRLHKQLGIRPWKTVADAFDEVVIDCQTGKLKDKRW